MSDSSHRFLVGFTRAVERRAQQTKQQEQQEVQKVATDAVAIDIVTSDAIITTPQDHDEMYRTTTVKNMVALIKQRKMK